MLKKLAGQTAVYGLTTIVGRFLNYLLTPIHSSVFEAADFGVITELYAYIVILNVIYTYGMETAYFRFATKDSISSISSYANAFSAVFFSSLIFSSIIFFFAPDIASLLDYPDKAKIIRWIAFILFIDAVVAIPFARIRLLKKIYLFSGAKLSSIFLNIIFNVFFLLVCPLVMQEGKLQFLKPYISLFYYQYEGIDYVFISNLLSNLAYLPFLIPAFKGLKFKFNFQQVREMAVYGFPILILGIGGSFNDMFSRLMLKDLLPNNFYEGVSKEAALGIFGACYKMSVFMLLAIQAFKFASDPFFFSNAADKNAPKLFARVMKYFVLCCCTILILVVANKAWIADILIRRDEYKQGLGIVAPLLLANIFMGIYFNLSVWYKLTDRTIWGTYITFFGSAITIVLNLYLIPVMGYHGSVLATVACYFGMMALSYFVGQRYYEVPYPIFTILGFLLISYGFVYYFESQHYSILNGLLIGNAGAILFFGLAIVFDKYLRK